MEKINYLLPHQYESLSGDERVEYLEKYKQLKIGVISKLIKSFGDYTKLSNIVLKKELKVYETFNILFDSFFGNDLEKEKIFETLNNCNLVQLVDFSNFVKLNINEFKHFKDKNQKLTHGKIDWERIQLDWSRQKIDYSKVQSVEDVVQITKDLYYSAPNRFNLFLQGRKLNNSEERLKYYADLNSVIISEKELICSDELCKTDFGNRVGLLNLSKEMQIGFLENYYVAGLMEKETREKFKRNTFYKYFHISSDVVETDLNKICASVTEPKNQAQLVKEYIDFFSAYKTENNVMAKVQEVLCTVKDCEIKNQLKQEKQKKNQNIFEPNYKSKSENEDSLIIINSALESVKNEDGILSYVKHFVPAFDSLNNALENSFKQSSNTTVIPLVTDLNNTGELKEVQL